MPATAKKCREPGCKRVFDSTNGERVHFLRMHKHKGKQWRLANRKGGKLSAGKKTLLQWMVQVLSDYPEGLRTAQLTKELNKAGLKTGAAKGVVGQFSSMVRLHPEAGIIRPRQGFYQLADGAVIPTTPKRRQSKIQQPLIAEPVNREEDIQRRLSQHREELIMALCNVVMMAVRNPLADLE